MFIDRIIQYPRPKNGSRDKDSGWMNDARYEHTKAISEEAVPMTSIVLILKSFFRSLPILTLIEQKVFFFFR